MNDKISVIIPLYNKSSHIARAINSVLSQTVPDFEIIIVDDQSSDEGPEIVKSYNDARISFIEQDHRGVSYTRNHGVDLAKGDFIVFLDSDDEWTPNHLEILIRLKKRFPDAGVYACAYQKYVKSGKVIYANYRAIPKSHFEGLLPNYFESAALGAPPVTMSTIGIFKELFFKMGGFPVDQIIGEDVDFLAKIAMKYPIAFSTDIGAIIHEEASNRAGDTYHSWLEEDLVVKNGKKAIIDGIVPESILPSLKKYIERKEIGTAEYHIYFGNYSLARKILARIETHNFWLEKIKWSIVMRIPKSIINQISHIKTLLYL